MQPAVIEGFTHSPGQPEGWDEEKHGKVRGLPIRAEMIEGIPWMTSAWEPTPRELAALNSGATVQLGIQGNAHPVVNLGVGTPPIAQAGEIAPISIVLTHESDEAGAVWCRLDAKFAGHPFKASMEIGNLTKPDVPVIAFDDACARLISAVLAHARKARWVK